MITDDDIERVLLDFARVRGHDRSLCPSEVARTLAGGADWRGLMPAVHRIAVGLAATGQVVLMQRGVALPPRPPRGAYRIRIGAPRPAS
jgi:hypothetical protein